MKAVRLRARGRQVLRTLVVAGLALSLVSAEAQPADRWELPAGPQAQGPWYGSDAPLPAWATAVRILRTDESLLVDASKGAARRGSAAREARLPLFAARGGAGCSSPWYSVGPEAWVCGDNVELSRGTPIPADVKTYPHSADGLPYRYYFVGPNGTSTFKRLREVGVGEPAQVLDPGFAVGILEERSFEGQRYGLSGNDYWIPMSDLNPARPISFQGAEVPVSDHKQVPFGWVVASSARVYSKPNRAAITSESLPQFMRVDVVPEAGPSKPSDFLQLGEKRWVLAKEVRHQSVASPPDEVNVNAHERWIDVELASQTLTAFEGDQPIFATIVSTGKGRPGSANATPKGTFRVWAKLGAANMDNLEDEGANRFWRMESVPYVQYFSKGVGLHGAYWHRGFGNVRSHGCVNLAPLDAQRLFYMTTPRLPAGWTAVLPSEHELGTVVRVR